MGIVFRQSIKTSFVVFAGALLGTFITWLSAKYIPKQQFGFTKNMTTYALIFSQISLLGLNSTIYVFIHKYTGRDERRKMLITLCLVIPIFFAILGTIPFYFMRPWVLTHFKPADIPYMDKYYMLMPVYTILFVLMTFLELYLGTQMKVAMAAFMREVVLRVATVAVILLFVMGYASFDFLVIGLALIYLIPVLIFAYMAVKTKDFGLSLKLSAFNRAEYKELFQFSWFHFLLSMSAVLMGYLDALALPLYDPEGLSSVAVYTVAVLLISFMQMPSKAMLIPTVTVLSKAITDNDTARAKDIFERSSINILLATLFMAVAIICNLDNAMILINKGYSQVGLIFLILFIGRFVDLATGLNDVVLSITKYYRFSFYVSVTMIAILFVLVRYLVPHYSVFGAAWATTITLVIYNICKYLFVWIKLDMQPFSMKTILVLICGAVACAAGYYFPHFLNNKGHMYVYALVDTGIRTGIIVVVYLLMLYWLKPSPDLRTYIASIKENKKLF